VLTFTKPKQGAGTMPPKYNVYGVKRPSNILDAFLVCAAIILAGALLFGGWLYQKSNEPALPIMDQNRLKIAAEYLDANEYERYSEGYRAGLNRGLSIAASECEKGT